MKISILSPAYPFRGGIAASTERLAVELQDMGHAVKIITFTKQYPNLLFPGKTQFSDGDAPHSLKIDRKIHSFNPFNWLKCGWQLRKSDADLFIVRYWIPFMAPALGTIMKIAKKNRRAIGFVDNIIPHEKHFYDSILSAYFVGAMDAFVVMSKSVKTELRSFTKKKSIHFSPHPIYDIYGQKPSKKEAKQILGLKEDNRYLLFFGFIRDYKGLDLLFEAMAKPVMNDQKTKLIVAGEFYGNQDKYEQLIDKLDIRNRVILKSDFIPDEEVKLYFAAADLLVQPYKTATQSGIAQIAYHFELPMVVTNVGGLPEIVIDGKSGYVVEPEPEAIAAAIQRFFSKNMSEHFHQGTIELKKRFSWKNLAMSFLNKQDTDI